MRQDGREGIGRRLRYRATFDRDPLLRFRPAGRYERGPWPASSSAALAPVIAASLPITKKVADL